jgi:hypothetical protein
MQLRGGKVKKGLVAKATNQSKPSMPNPIQAIKSRKYKKKKSKMYLLNNFNGRRKKILLVTTEDFKSWSGDAGVHHNFKISEIEVLFVESNTALIDKIHKDYKDKRFDCVVLAPGHGAKEDAKINWPQTFITYEDLFPCIKACISVTNHINIQTCYQGTIQTIR